MVLVQPERLSEEIFAVKGIPTAGLADGFDHEFDGVWYTMGETYQYETVRGTTRTIYVFRQFPLKVSEALDSFRKSQVKPAIAETLSGITEPTPPTGKDLEKLLADRADYREAEEVRKRRELERHEIERREAAERESARKAAAVAAQTARRQQEISRRNAVAAEKLRQAKGWMTTNAEAANKRLQELIDAYPTSPAAGEAEEMLNGQNKARYRTWTSGNFKKEAVLLGVQDGAAVLKKQSGEIVQVPVPKLSAEDQEVVASLVRSKKVKPVLTSESAEKNAQASVSDR